MMSKRDQIGIGIIGTGFARTTQIPALPCLRWRARRRHRQRAARERRTRGARVRHPARDRRLARGGGARRRASHIHRHPALDARGDDARGARRGQGRALRKTDGDECRRNRKDARGRARVRVARAHRPRTALSARAPADARDDPRGRDRRRAPREISLSFGHARHHGARVDWWSDREAGGGTLAPSARTPWTRCTGSRTRASLASRPCSRRVNSSAAWKPVG